MFMTSQAYLRGVHLVDGDDELTDTEGVGKQSVLAGLALLGDTSLELTSASSDDQDGAVSLRGSRDHVLDEVTVARSINDLHIRQQPSAIRKFVCEVTDFLR